MRRQLKVYKEAIKRSTDPMNWLENLHDAIVAAGDKVKSQYENLSEDNNIANCYLFLTNGIIFNTLLNVYKNECTITMYEVRNVTEYHEFYRRSIEIEAC